MIRKKNANCVIVTLRRIIKTLGQTCKDFDTSLNTAVLWITLRINFLVESVKRVRMFWDVATRIIKVANKLLAGIRNARWFTEYR